MEYVIGFFVVIISIASGVVIGMSGESYKERFVLYNDVTYLSLLFLNLSFVFYYIAYYANYYNIEKESLDGLTMYLIDKIIYLKISIWCFSIIWVFMKIYYFALKWIDEEEFSKLFKDYKDA